MMARASRRWPRWMQWGRRRALFALVAVLTVVPVAVGLTRLEVETDLSSFLPPGDPQLRAYERYAEVFGSDPIVVLVEPENDSETTLLGPDTLPRLLQLEGKLAGLDDVASVYGPATSLNQIAGQAQAIVAELVGRRDAEIAKAQVRAQREGASEAAVKAAGEKARERFDGRYGPLLVRAMPGGLPTLKNPRFADKVVFDEDGRPRAQWRYLVPNRNALAIVIRPEGGLDAEATSKLVRAVDSTMSGDRLAGSEVTVTGSPVVVDALSSRSLKEAPLLGALAIGAIGLCLWFGSPTARRRRLIPLAVTCAAVAVTLGILGLMGRPVSLGVVAFCPVLLGIGVYYPSYFALGARTRTVLTVAAATAASLATLALSPLPLVRDLGFTLALGVLVAAVLGLLARRWSGAETEEPAADSAADSTADSGDDMHTSPGAVRSAPVRRLTAVCAVTAVLLAGWGWSRAASLGVQSDVAYFAGGLSALADAEHVEDVMGSSGEVDLLVEGTAATSPEGLAWQTNAQREIAVEHGDQFRAAASLASMLDFLGPDPTQSQIDAALRLLPAYLTSAVLSDDRTKAVASFGVRLDDLPELGDEVAAVSKELPDPPKGADAELVGLPLVLVRTQELVAADRVTGSLWGVLGAVVLLLIGLRRRVDALRAAGAALVATGLTFATLALTGRALDPVTASLGALTAAVGCEFTIVYAEAVRRSSRRLRRTVFLVAATSTAGYLVLVASGLTAVRGLGLLLAIAVLQALCASVLVVETTLPRATPRPSPAPETPETPEREVVHV